MTGRTLALLRHAKAERPPGVADRDRPLSARGHADAHAAGAWLHRHHYLPDLVLCSPSKRTRQTWHGVTASLGVVSEVRYEQRLYSGDADDLLRVVRGIEDSVTTVLLIGHNPSISDLAFDLDPEGELDAGGLRTCGLTVHLFNGAWSDCGPGRAPIVASHTARAG